MQQRIRRVLYDWMMSVLEEQDWSAAAWARRAEVTPTNLTRFLKDPDTASLPSAETIGRLAWAAGSEPRFLGPVRRTGEPPAHPEAFRVPVLTSGELRYLQTLSPAAAEAYLDRLRRDGARTILLDTKPSRRAFALQVTSLHMNAGGLVPEDEVVLEPPDIFPPAKGDLVVTTNDEHVCGYRYHPPLLVPVSTDSNCEPVLLRETALIGVALQVVRRFKRQTGADILPLPAEAASVG